MLNHTRTANRRQTGRHVIGDSCCLGHFAQERHHPNVKAVAAGEDSLSLCHSVVGISFFISERHDITAALPNAAAYGNTWGVATIDLTTFRWQVQGWRPNTWMLCDSVETVTIDFARKPKPAYQALANIFRGG